MELGVGTQPKAFRMDLTVTVSESDETTPDREDVTSDCKPTSTTTKAISVPQPQLHPRPRAVAVKSTSKPQKLNQKTICNESGSGGVGGSGDADASIIRHLQKLTKTIWSLHGTAAEVSEAKNDRGSSSSCDFRTTPTPTSQPSAPKRKPGRPPNSSKKSLEEILKKKPGRPPKPHLPLSLPPGQNQNQNISIEIKPEKKRGRPSKSVMEARALAKQWEEEEQQQKQFGQNQNQKMRDGRLSDHEDGIRSSFDPNDNIIVDVGSESEYESESDVPNSKERSTIELAPAPKKKRGRPFKQSKEGMDSMEENQSQNRVGVGVVEVKTKREGLKNKMRVSDSDSDSEEEIPKKRSKIRVEKEEEEYRPGYAHMREIAHELGIPFQRKKTARRKIKKTIKTLKPLKLKELMAKANVPDPDSKGVGVVGEKKRRARPPNSKNRTTKYVELAKANLRQNQNTGNQNGINANGVKRLRGRPRKDGLQVYIDVDVDCDSDSGPEMICCEFDEATKSAPAPTAEESLGQKLQVKLERVEWPWAPTPSKREKDSESKSSTPVKNQNQILTTMASKSRSTSTFSSSSSHRGIPIPGYRPGPKSKNKKLPLISTNTVPFHPQAPGSGSGKEKSKQKEIEIRVDSLTKIKSRTNVRNENYGSGSGSGSTSKFEFDLDPDTDTEPESEIHFRSESETMEMEPISVEVCVDNFESVLNAANGGANRIEMCSALSEGGLTPTLGLLRLSKAQLNPSIPIFVMIRPRGGDFVYSDHEFDIMVIDIQSFKQCGADGFVFGALTPEGEVDERVKMLVKAAAPFPCTFHRAFDHVSNTEKSLERIVQLGFERILTSGQQSSAQKGIPAIKELVRVAKGRISIMPGCGINAGNVGEIVRETGVTEVHGSASAKMKSRMINKNTVSMSTKDASEDSAYSVCDAATVAQIVRNANRSSLN